MKTKDGSPDVIVIAVHGIGDQVRQATIQGVAEQFSRHYYEAACKSQASKESSPRNDERRCCASAPIALGHFDAGLVCVAFGRDEASKRTFGFAEAHWADIPRTAAADNYTLEETKQWATGVVDRLGENPAARQRGVNYPLVRRVIEEMIETIGLLENIAFLADKAGIVHFDLNKILTDYVNDVQAVAEFKRLRNLILDRFHSAMKALNEAHPRAEFHIVAHSEGTVVSFLGLLQAMWDQQPPPWLAQVRGYMTIGSPIDKHIVLWDELFSFEGPCPYQPATRIRWRNYYDFGDPVGFKLDTARDWLANNQVKAFEFDPPPTTLGDTDPHHDNGFSRYYLPGKAHNDYWQDDAVFDHFIQSVVEKPCDPPRPIEPPKNKAWVWPVTYLASYGITLLMLAAGLYAVERAIVNFNQIGMLTERWVGDIAGLAFLIAGLTVVARIPRLVSPGQKGFLKWLSLSLLIFVACGALYRACASAATQSALGWLPRKLLEAMGKTDASVDILTLGTLVMVLALGTLAAWTGRKEPRAGMKPLLLWGGLTATVMIFLMLKWKPDSPPPVWPVTVAIVIFLSLWWLAALLFDLIFVWHRYIRHEAGHERLKAIYATACAAKITPRPTSGGTDTTKHGN